MNIKNLPISDEEFRNLISAAHVIWSNIALDMMSAAEAEAVDGAEVIELAFDANRLDAFDPELSELWQELYKLCGYKAVETLGKCVWQ